MNFSKAIIYLRTLKGWKQNELAKKLKKTPNSINIWEKGTQTPNKNTISQLCKVFEIPETFFYILAIEEVEKPPKKISEHHSTIDKAINKINHKRKLIHNLLGV